MAPKRVSSVWEDRRELLADYREAGVKFGLSTTGQLLMFYREPEGGLPYWRKAVLEGCRHEFTEALRNERGLCIGCGDAPAMHPILDGWRQIYDPETGMAVIKPSKKYSRVFGFFEGVKEPSKASPEEHARNPKIWCDCCWERGRDLEWLAARLRTCGPVPQIFSSSEEGKGEKPAKRKKVNEGSDYAVSVVEDNPSLDGGVR